MDVFEKAGNRFLSDQEKFGEARIKAIDELNSIQEFCETGVIQFYKTITEGGQPDVYVKRKLENLVYIEYGLRPCRHDIILKGPMAAILVTPEGEIGIAKDKEWLPVNSPDPNFKGRPLSIESWEIEISRWLIEFMEESEREYRRMCQ